MSKVLYEQLLASLKRANKVRKLAMAIKAGYASVENYKLFLEQQIAGASAEEPAKATGKKPIKPTIHVVDILDCSGSMSGGKIEGTVKGINEGIAKLKEDSTANFTYTLCDFADSHDINFKHTKAKLAAVGKISLKSRGMTALYDAIGKTLEKFNKVFDANEKVLINIYTDGQENVSRTYSKLRIANIIKEAPAKGITITFIGTEFDTETVIKTLNIDASNTLSYDGSAKGLSKSLGATVSARSTFTASVVKGEDVSKGFYKNIDKKL